MEKLKIWAVEVGIKKLAPSAIRAALAAFVAILIAHTEALKALGIVYDQTTQDLTIHLKELSAWVGVTGIGLLTAFFAAMQHHGEAAIYKKPQSGDMREQKPFSVKGGDRETDPPKGALK